MENITLSGIGKQTVHPEKVYFSLMLESVTSYACVAPGIMRGVLHVPL